MAWAETCLKVWLFNYKLYKIIQIKNKNKLKIFFWKALVRLGLANTKLISAVANDMSGRFILDESKKLGFDTSAISLIDNNHEHISTGSYCAIFNPNGELKLAIGDMKAHDYIRPSLVQKHAEMISNSDLCVLDADIPVETIDFVCAHCEANSIPVWCNPTDVRKCNKVINSLAKLTYISPNLKELFALFRETVSRDQEHHLGI